MDEDELEALGLAFPKEKVGFDSPRFANFVRFSRAQIESGDIDPTYPVLKSVYQARNYSKEQALWYTLLYVTWYNLGSSEVAFERLPEPPKKPIRASLKMPTGIERRSFRGNELARDHLNAILEAAEGSLTAWVEGMVGDGGEAGWDRVRTGFQTIQNAGPWSSYKLADLLAHVHDYPITASDLGIGGASETAGPIPGMVLLTGHDWKRCATDRGLQREMLAEARKQGTPLSGLDQLETCLCDFNSLSKGRYYVGHDIDAQQEHLKNADDKFWIARREVFPERYLGEVNGWSGVRKDLKKVYLIEDRIVQL